MMSKEEDDDQEVKISKEQSDKSDEFDWDFILDREWMRTKK